MDFFVIYIMPFVLAYKYWALSIVSFVAAFCIPIPSGSALMAVSAFASDGYFNIWIIIIISIIANILGDNLGYFISYKYGDKILSSIGFRRIIHSKTFKNIEEKFRNKPGFIIYISRFEVVSTLLVNLLSGVSKVPYRKYISHEIPGTISQVIVYSMIGYIFGYNWKTINTVMGKIFLVLLFMVILLIFTYWKKIMIHKRKIAQQ